MLLELRNVSKVFGGVRALQSVSFDVAPGEVLCLAGENGCGKSTLIKIISGVYRPEPGAEMLFDGKPMEGLTPGMARSLGIQVIWQDLALFPEMTVAENIAFERNLGGRPRLVDYGAMRKVAAEMLARLGVSIDLDTPVRELSIAQRQIVAICRALIAETRLVFMDEPTASLSQSETDALLAIVRRLSADGIAVVFVSHRLAEVLEVCSRVTVLRDGRYVGTFPTEGMTQTRLTELMTGQTFDQDVRAADRTANPVVLEVEGLTRRGDYQDISLTVRRGEVVGITGQAGSGADGTGAVAVRHDSSRCRNDQAERPAVTAAVQSRRDRRRHRLCVGGPAVAGSGPAAVDRRQHGDTRCSTGCSGRRGCCRNARNPRWSANG